jgi:predicted CoA-binding protein
MTGRLLSRVEDKAALLSSCRTIAVVGLSNNPARPAYGVARALLLGGWRILPVHPRGGVVLGQAVYPKLADLPVRPDLVDVFRNPTHMPDLVEEILALPAPLRPRALWLQDRVLHPVAAETAVRAGLVVVMDDCTARIACWLMDRAR